MFDDIVMYESLSLSGISKLYIFYWGVGVGIVVFCLVSFVCLFVFFDSFVLFLLHHVYSHVWYKHKSTLIMRKWHVIAKSTNVMLIDALALCDSIYQQWKWYWPCRLWQNLSCLLGVWISAIYSTLIQHCAMIYRIFPHRNFAWSIF